MSTISVKLHVAKEVRRFAIARNISLAAFHHFVCEKLVPTLKEYKNHLHYVYVDDEEDTVKILLEEEWREALNVAESNDGYITLKITRHGAPTKTPQQEQQQQARFAYACPRFAARCQPQQQQEQQHCPRYAQFFGCPRFAQQQQACPRYQQQQQQQQAPQGNPWSALFQTVLKDMCAQVPKQEAPKQEQQSNEESVAFDLESILNQVFGKQQQQQEQAKQQPQQAKKQETPAPVTTTSVPVQQVVVDAVPSANKQEELEQAAKQQEQEVATEHVVLEEPVVVAVETKPEPVEQQQVPVVQQQVAEPQQQANTPDYQLELNALQSMGFTNAKFNLHLLNHHNGNMAKVIDTLLTIKLE